MEKKMKAYTLPGSADAAEQEYEVCHRQLVRRAAADGMVLLKNENQMLPFAAGARLALYGAGAVATIKGGTGSGDVNSRATVSVYEGLKQAGFEIVNEDWIASYRSCYQKAREDWREQVWADAERLRQEQHPDPVFAAYADHQFDLPAGDLPTPVEADAAVYVIARIAGEAKDRQLRQGDYLLSGAEHESLRLLCEQHARVLVVINSGGLIDLSFLDEFSQIQALIYMGQPGMEAGHSLADLVSGAVSPSAKLTDSWPYRYEDYPNAQTFSHMNGDTTQEYYTEGIYVGYRYFDTFEVPVRYSFGFGLSYTTFDLRLVRLQFVDQNTKHARLCMTVQVTNTGAAAGREVVQIYVSCPQKNMEKEYRRLAGFAKTQLLEPGKSQEVVVGIPVAVLASYSEKAPGWLLDRGTYGFFMGNSLQNAVFAASVELTKNLLLQKTDQICPLRKELTELAAPVERVLERRAQWHALVCKHPAIVVPTHMLPARKIFTYGGEDARIAKQIWDETDALRVEQLTALVTGAFTDDKGALGAAGSLVPGSAAQTSDCAAEQGIAAIVLADGPAGLRLTQTCYVKDGAAQQLPIEASIENGYLYRGEPADGDRRYQYCTAFPTGTQLAQTWDQTMLEEVGAAVADEMRLFGVTLWLAPGMNIHRNPLCGRNYEYYSEDPLLSGRMASAVTRGVQEKGDVGTTIKHFACNNQEDNRTGSDSIVSERALREIYLKGFEIAVCEQQPLAIMTSYNLVNGVHAANSYDLCTKVARDEWHFKGVIMTDWTTTQNGPDCTAAGCMRAGNDLVMPGVEADHENIRQALADGSLELVQLKRSVAHLLPVIFASDRYEHAGSVQQ